MPSGSGNAQANKLICAQVLSCARKINTGVSVHTPVLLRVPADGQIRGAPPGLDGTGNFCRIAHYLHLYALRPRRAIHTGKTAAAGHTRTTKNEIWAAPLAA